MTGHSVGPLDGAAAPRPDGWLPAPLTTRRRAAEAQARELLATHHPAFAGMPVRCLTARYRSHVIRLGDKRDPCAVLKRHAGGATYVGEALAYDVLRGERVLPELLDLSDDANTVIVEHVQPTEIAAAGAFEELITAVAAVHTAPLRWPTHVAVAMAPWRLDRALIDPAPGWVTRGDAWRLVQHLHGEAYGYAHVPLGHLDLKPEHIRRHPDGSIAIIDAETLRPDLTGAPDVITLAWLARLLDHPRPQWVRHAYRTYANEAGAAWSDAALIRALRAWAHATGLRSLHGVDR